MLKAFSFFAFFSFSVSVAPESSSKHLAAFTDPLLIRRSIESGLFAANNSKSCLASLSDNTLFCFLIAANTALDDAEISRQQEETKDAVEAAQRNTSLVDKLNPFND